MCVFVAADCFGCLCLVCEFIVVLMMFCWLCWFICCLRLLFYLSYLVVFPVLLLCLCGVVFCWWVAGVSAGGCVEFCFSCLELDT